MQKLPLQHFLFFSPYDSEFAYSQTLNINDFEKIRVIPNDFLEEKEHLEKIINPKSIVRFFILSGYSGNGKTTFGYWFKEHLETKNYYFEIINLIQKGYGVEKKEPLMLACIKDVLSKTLIDKEVIYKIADNRAYFSTIFTQTQLSEICRIRSNASFDIAEANYLLDILNFKQILILFILQRVIHFCKDEKLMNKQSYTFCFDNLDELELEYLTPDMWEIILEVSQMMPEIIMASEINFEFALKVKFVLVFREANIAVASAQLNDKLVPLTKNRRFILTPFIGKDIIQERINEYDEDDCDEEDKKIIRLLKIIIKEKITDYIILPLFNYDYRRFITATLEMINDNFIDLTDINYSAIPHDFKFGKRGILINAYVKYLAKYNYLNRLAPRRELDKEQIYCNTIRLMLSVFSNLSYDRVDFPKDESKKEFHEAKPNEFSLIEAYDLCKIIVSIPDFFDKIVELVDINKSSWAHLITIYGKEPIREGNKYKFDFTDEKNILERFTNNKTITNNEKHKIDVILFSLNASAYIYLRHLLPHFEYMSAYKAGRENTKPLFQLTEFNLKERKWEFQIQLEDVFKHIETYCANIEKHFQETFVKKTSITTKELFLRSKYVFKGDVNKKTRQDIASLYMTRLITSHIGYIEAFRHYITGLGFEKIEKNTDKLPEGFKKLTITTKEEIHNYILTIIDKYLKELENRQDPTQTKIQADLKSTLEQAKIDHSIWVAR